MGTHVFACGCSISKSMFADGNYLFVDFCIHHVQDSRAQALLEQTARTMREIYDEDPVVEGDISWPDGTSFESEEEK